MKDECSCDVVHLHGEQAQHHHHSTDLVWGVLLHQHMHIGPSDREAVRQMVMVWHAHEVEGSW